MQAIVRTSYGPPDILTLQEEAIPRPAENRVLVRVHAASVNPVDWHVLRGTPFIVRLFGFGLLKPKHRIIGADLAGRVEEVGSGVTAFKAGDDVYGSGIGAFAEFACFPQNALAPKPAALSYEQAAAVPVAAITALQGLRDHGRLQAGQHVLINGASGGVGTFAVQIAKAMGARVTGVCSTRNIELVQSIGADHVIDYTRENFADRVGAYDLILDMAAKSVSTALRALTPFGTYVLVGGTIASLMQVSVLKPLLPKKGRRKLVSMLARITTADLRVLNGYAESGKLMPVIDRTYSLRDVPEALRYVETGHARGKVVVTIRS